MVIKRSIVLICLWSSVALADPFNLDREHVPGQLIVKFKNAHLKTEDAKSLGLLSSFGGTSVYQFKSRGARLVKFSHALNESSLLEVAKELRARPEIEYVEANTILHINTIPNDSDFSKQYSMHNTGQNGGVVGADIKADLAWDISTGSKNILVGVIDTGIDYTHPDIAPNYWTNPGESGLDANGKDKKNNGIDDDGNGFIDDYRGWNFVSNTNDPMDDHSHGTHCAGVIGARGNDGAGIAGINWKVSLVAIKFLNGSGSGSLEDAVKAIEYANSVGVNLTSNSWGGGSFSQTLMDAIKGSQDRGILFVAAAGNDSNNNDSTPSYPSGYKLKNVIAVAASNNKDEMADFSNFGSRTVHVAAPGVDIYSSIPERKYKTMSGTSMAAPHVAGLAALIKSAFPAATGDQVKSRIVYGVDHLPYWANKVASGGRINAWRSLQKDDIPPAKIPDFRLAEASSKYVRFLWQPVGDDGMKGKASAYEIRTSKKPIITETDWNLADTAQATIVDGLDVMAGVIDFDDFNQSGFAAIRAYDKVGNMSPISASVAFATKKLILFYDHDASTMNGFTAETPWAIETLKDGTKAFSDSPGGDYQNSINISLTSATIKIPKGDLWLTLDIRYETEQGFDVLNVEYTSDSGKTWTTIDKISGTSNLQFVKRSMGIKGTGLGDTIQIRFRFQTDTSVTKDGVYIKNISIGTPEQ